MREVTLPCFFISLPKDICNCAAGLEDSFVNHLSVKLISSIKIIIIIIVGPFSEKICDRGLENSALALRPRAAFSFLISQFFAMRTDPEPFLFELNWLTSGFVYATLSFNRLTRRLQNRFISNYFMLFAFSSTVKFSKIVFPV